MTDATNIIQSWDLILNQLLHTWPCSFHDIGGVRHQRNCVVKAVLSRLSPFFVTDSFKDWNKLVVVPVFTTGMSKNHVRTSPTCGSRNRVRAMHDLFVLSLDSSIRKEKGKLDIDSITLCLKWGARAFFTMGVVLVRAQENFSAISVSGNILLKSLVAWWLHKKDMLCLATNVVHLTSALIS